jgi:hypothetical protein
MSRGGAVDMPPQAMRGVLLAADHSMTRTLGIVGLVVAALAGVSSAGRKEGVTMPDTTTVENQQLALNGMGLREATFLDIDVYVVGLYVQHPTSNADALIHNEEIKQLVLQFVRDVGHKDIVKAWREGFTGNATVPLAQLEPYMAQLASWMPSFKKGDTLRFTYIPNQGVTVDINGVRKGVINNPDFARSLFAIWLGRKPPTNDVKRGLLGSHPSS